MAVHDVAFYTLEIWDSDLTGRDLTIAGGSATFRLPPQAITIEQGYRTDFGLDLNGDPVIAEAGFGPGRWTIRGCYGIGQQGLSDLATNLDQGLITYGMDNRLDIINVLQTYASTNAQNVAEGKPLSKLVFKVQSGGPSEFKNEIWWILPMGLPTDDRTSSRPLDWSYSLTFWALQRVDAMVPPVDMLNGNSIDGLMGILNQLTKTIKAIQRTLDISNWPIVQTIRGTITAVQGTISAAKNLVSTVKSDFQGAADLLRSAAFAVNSVTQTVHAAATLPVQAKQDFICALKDMRVAIGQSLISIETNGELILAPLANKPVPVIPNRDLRQIAATVLGDESQWTTIAAQNNLVYPYVSWPTSSGTAAASGLIPGLVATPGSILTVPPKSAPQKIQDPVGLDLDPGGTETLVGSLKNVVNALQRRLDTPRGYLPQHPHYGSSLSRYFGAPLTVDTALAIRGEVARTLLQDPRVISVPNVTVDTDSTNGKIAATATVVTILGLASFAVTGT
jgi:phage baseplate assembly protein W